MKTALSGLELHYLVQELKLLENSRVDKIYHPDKKEILIQFHVSGKGKHILRILAGEFIYFTKTKDAAEEPSGFCMYLRKYIGSAFLKEVKQLGAERILEFIFETKGKEYSLVVEMFSQGNILLLENNIILSAVEYHKFKDRSILAKTEYSYPKRDVNIFELTLTELKEVVKSSDKENIVKTLAIDLGFGGVYSEEICLRAGVDKNKKDITSKEFDNILSAIKKILKIKSNPLIIYKDNKMSDLVPFDLEIYKDNKKKNFPTLSEAIDTFKSSTKIIKKSAKEKQIEKQERIIEAQEKKMSKRKAKVVEKDWGREIWMVNNQEEDYCGKILQINQGYNTSLHFHFEKNETFYIKKGMLQVDFICTLDGVPMTQILNEGDTLTINRGQPHQLIAYDGDVEFIEISTYHKDSDSLRISR